MMSESSKKDQLEDLQTRLTEQESLVSHLRKKTDGLSEQLNIQLMGSQSDKVMCTELRI